MVRLELRILRFGKWRLFWVRNWIGRRFGLGRMDDESESEYEIGILFIEEMEIGNGDGIAFRFFFGTLL